MGSRLKPGICEFPKTVSFFQMLTLITLLASSVVQLLIFFWEGKGVIWLVQNNLSHFVLYLTARLFFK